MRNCSLVDEEMEHLRPIIDDEKKNDLKRKRKESDQPNKRILLLNITVLHNMDIIS